MKKMVLVLLFLFGLVGSVFAKQRVSFWKAETEEQKENIFSWCQIEITVFVYMGYRIDCVALNDDGYLIVYEDFE